MNARSRAESETAPVDDRAAEGATRVDWAGTAHDVAVGRPRIACLVPSLTETLFALGVGDDVVARTGFCIHPRERVRDVAKVGGTKDPDLRKLEALAPTHLIVNVDENRREDVDAARAFVEHVIVTHPMAPADNARLVRLLGAIFDRDGEAARLAASIDREFRDLAAQAARLPRERVLYLIWRKPWMTVSSDTYVSRTLALAGLETVEVESDARYPALDDADPAWDRAARILLSTEPYAFRPRDADALRTTLAKPVDLIDGEWTSWYGARAAIGARALREWRGAAGAIPGSSARRQA
jgi:ABC-type Fe3+-hydroxamate transport system substrate-binding protein